jgi:CRP/FNR family cyclic AMP-dependent transcriptional regulator
MKLRGTQNDAVVEMLGKTPLWTGLSEKDLKSIVAASKERKFEAGDAIVRKGETGVGFYLILEGSVEVRSASTTLSKLGAGQFFGEMSLLDNQPRSADVIAAEPSRCLVLTGWAFNAMIASHPEIAVTMLREFARRLRITDQSMDK